MGWLDFRGKTYGGSNMSAKLRVSGYVMAAPMFGTFIYTVVHEWSSMTSSKFPYSKMLKKSWVKRINATGHNSTYERYTKVPSTVRYELSYWKVWISMNRKAWNRRRRFMLRFSAAFQTWHARKSVVMIVDFLSLWIQHRARSWGKGNRGSTEGIISPKTRPSPEEHPKTPAVNHFFLVPSILVFHFRQHWIVNLSGPKCSTSKKILRFPIPRDWVVSEDNGKRHTADQLAINLEQASNSRLSIQLGFGISKNATHIASSGSVLSRKEKVHCFLKRRTLDKLRFWSLYDCEVGRNEK